MAIATALRGDDLLRVVINQIIQHPETWGQASYHTECGTKHCVAGWAQILAGRPANGITASADAREVLDLSRNDTTWLFSAFRTLPEIYDFAAARLGGYVDGFDCAGYNRDGLDRDGYDRNGYDRNGYNRNGYDRDGYDRAGYDYNGRNRAGFNRDGYTCDGYDCDGYNHNGYDREGYNRAGYNRHGYTRDSVQRKYPLL